MPRYIDMTPTWGALMPALLAVIENGAETGREAARAELHRLADMMDAQIEENRMAAVREQAEYEAEREPITRFTSITWGKNSDGHPITVLTIEGEAADVASYAMVGHQASQTDLQTEGTKLTETKARGIGAGWPVRLTYRA